MELIHALLSVQIGMLTTMECHTMFSDDITMQALRKLDGVFKRAC